MESDTATPEAWIDAQVKAKDRRALVAKHSHLLCGATITNQSVHEHHGAWHVASIVNVPTF